MLLKCKFTQFSQFKKSRQTLLLKIETILLIMNIIGCKKDFKSIFFANKNHVPSFFVHIKTTIK